MMYLLALAFNNTEVGSFLIKAILCMREKPALVVVIKMVNHI